MQPRVDLFNNLLSHSNNVKTGSDEEPVPEQDSSSLGHSLGSGVSGDFSRGWSDYGELVTNPLLGQRLDVLCLFVCDEIVIKYHIRLQALNLTSYWLQQ